ncbi:uncharacterized protein NEMAJ01_1112 [Nematocida major]|uniref:uncharacterized protein n=1 Tax=Nematocida major TaxID=1912982 RepID=UPI0020080DC5|nr:uncharacterized protein NEMAJ01_1112 [Nematocida major]KAH9386216.1 hypothetical protein NEMAJ01_1112 [Nematocida major]
MEWRSIAYAFYAQTNCINDLEFLQIVCDEFSWHLYAEESKKGTNYMISGKTFVIDIFYEREEEDAQTEDAEDTHSVGSSVIQIGKERMESVYRNIKSVSLSLIEEEWSGYFKLCTFSIMHHLKNKDYYNAYKVLSSLVKYDTEDEAAGFGSIVQRLKSIAEADAVKVGYSFVRDMPVAYYSIESTGVLCKEVGLFSYVQPDHTRRLYNISREEEIPKSTLCIDVIIEMLIYNIEVCIESSISMEGKIDGVLCRIEVREDGFILVNGNIDTYRTLLLKRTDSMYHVIRETGIEIEQQARGMHA